MVMRPEDVIDSSSVQGVDVEVRKYGFVGRPSVLSVALLLIAFRSSSGIFKTYL